MTDTPKHTPGPWRKCGGYTPEHICVYADGHGYIVFGMADYAVHKEGIDKEPVLAPDAIEQHANADRIVACVNACEGIANPEETVPELLEACKAVLEYGCPGTVDSDEDPENFIDVSDMLREVIAKATGQEIQS